MNNPEERWSRTEAIFHEVIATEEPERTAILSARCGDDTALMDELRALLKACEAEELHRATATETSAAKVSGRRVGPYAIDTLLGRGGMGAVYLAHRDDGQFEQQVAIKIIDMPLASDLFRDRFRAERQILAGLSHPYIARLLDGGVSEDGELYLAMEYVDGVSITRFCEEKHLSIKDRLLLFRKVCEAVQYAHQNLIVHRDLKPDNILVLEDGSPRLLDFGTAKILTPIAQDAGGDLTRSGVQAFTPRYASPEQVLGQPITIASDVYSLGVLLYVLLTTRAPYELVEFTTEEMVRVICGQEPQRPGAVASSVADSSVGRVDSDLDSIVLKALRKEPQQRYSTVEQLAADIDAYLGQRPVQARRGDLKYRAEKFIRRNRLALAAATLVAVSLLIGVAGIIWQARRANQQRLRAEDRATDLRELSSSLLSELDDAIKQVPGSTNAQRLIVTRMLQHLDRLSKDGEDDQITQLDVADAYMRVANLEGNPYDQNIGDTTGALASIDKAVAITEHLKETNPKDAGVLHAYALAHQSRSEILFGMERSAEAIASMRKASATLGFLANQTGATSLQLSEAATAYGGEGDELGQSGRASMGDSAAALVVYKQSLQFQQRALQRDPTSKRALLSIPVSLMKIGYIEADTDPYEAIRQYRLSLKALDQYPSQDKNSFRYKYTHAGVQRKLAMSLIEVGDYSTATALLEDVRKTNEAYARADPSDGRSATDLGIVLENEATVFEDLADPELNPLATDRAQQRRHAETLLIESAAAFDSELKHNPNDRTIKAQVASIQVRIGTLQFETPRQKEGALLAARGLATLRQMSASSTPNTQFLSLISTSLLIVKPDSLRNPDEALGFAKHAVDLSGRHKPSYLLTLAQAYRDSGDRTDAQRTAQEGLALLAPIRPGEGSTLTRRLLENVVASPSASGS